MDNKVCKKENCNIKTQTSQDDYCIFHSKDKKMSLQNFKKELIEYSKDNNNFSEFIIPCDLELKDKVYRRGLLLDRISILGELKILNCKIQGQFKLNDSIFNNYVQISCINRLQSNEFEEIDTRDTRYQCDIRMENSTFNKGFSLSNSFLAGLLKLDNAEIFKKSSITSLDVLGYIFMDKLKVKGDFQFMNNNLNNILYCLKSEFKNHLNLNNNFFLNHAVFANCFIEDNLILDGAKIGNIGVSINNTRINGEFSLKKLDIKGAVNVKNLLLGQNTTIITESPIIQNNEKTTGSINFENIIFNPYKTFFRSIENIDSSINAAIKFKHCDLTNAYFEKCNFNDISLFTSKFSNANFITCKWYSKDANKIGRKNVIYEDRLYNTNKDKALINTPLLNSLEISYLYNQFKNAFDTAKKYNFSGDFYYNELDSKRDFYKLTNFPLWLLYTIYKYLTWFGQRPQYCALILISIIVSYSTYNLLNGFKVIYENNTEIINYNINKYYYSFFLQEEFWKDFGNALIYGLNRILPLNYSKFSEQSYYTETPSFVNYIVNILYSLVSLVYLYSMIIGLRRHFKRF